MNNRIKEIRKALHLSQEKFGEKLGVSRDVISNIEYGRAPLKDVMARHICVLFNINEEWLNHGSGDMFSSKPNKNLDAAIDIFKELSPEFQDYALKQLQQLKYLSNKSKD